MITYAKKNKKVFQGIDLANFDKAEYISRFDKLVVPGIYTLIAIYKPLIETMTAGGVYIPAIAQDEEGEYSSSVGLLIQVGSEAFQGKYFPNGAYAKVGDWVQFNRAACTQGSYEGMPYVITEDNKIRLVIDSPDKF